MKRSLRVLALVGVAVVLIAALAVYGQSYPRAKESRDPLLRAEEMPKKEQSFASARSSASAPKTTADSDKLIDELATILQETKSPETFLVTAMTLGRLGPKARRTLPVVIRNAERLQLLDGLCDPHISNENRATAQGVVEVIEMILGASTGVSTWPAARSPQPVCYPATPAASYSYTVPAAVTPTLPPAPSPQLATPPQPPSSSMLPPGISQSEERLAPVPCVAR
jgi:hypothetical protein